MLKRKDDRSFLERAQKGMEDWRGLMEERGTRRDFPMKPQVVAWELGQRLRSDAIVSCDSGTIATWWARQIPAQRDQMHSLSGNLATMANGLPYAIAAQVAYPARQCVAFVGDGGFSMLMAEFVTCVKYQLPVKVIIIKNDTLGQIKWEQMVFLGNPEYGCDLHPIDFAAVARACGGTGFTIERAEHCGHDPRPGAGHRRAPSSSRRWSIRSSPPFPPKSRWSRRPCSPNLSCADSQTARKSLSRSWATGCASSFERRAVARRSEALMAMVPHGAWMSKRRCRDHWRIAGGRHRGSRLARGRLRR